MIKLKKLKLNIFTKINRPRPAKNASKKLKQSTKMSIKKSFAEFNKSFSDFITEFENLKNENEKLKEFVKELSKKSEKKSEIKFAKFHDLTFLYPSRFPGYVQADIEKEYHNIIKDHITKNKYEFNDGDIIFIGSTYETRQYYGFANIEGNDFITGEFPSTGGYDGVYYVDAIDEINEFWINFEGTS
jgi:hypothetical protein